MRSGSFACLGDLFAAESLFELRDYRISRVMPKGEAVQQFAASMHLALDLADKYPSDSSAAHILDVAQFFPCAKRCSVSTTALSVSSVCGTLSAAGGTFES